MLDHFSGDFTSAPRLCCFLHKQLYRGLVIKSSQSEDLKFPLESIVFILNPAKVVKKKKKGAQMHGRTLNVLTLVLFGFGFLVYLINWWKRGS